MKNKVRTSITVILAIATSVTLAKSLLDSTVRASQVASYRFPQSIALASWQLAASRDTLESIDVSGDILATQQYEYQQKERNLTINARYLANTDGDLKSIVEDRIGNLTPALKRDRNGDYALYTYQGKAYLDACLNPRGSSTVTSDRFKRNRTIYGFDSKRIVPWLLGRRDLQDKRCLWMQLVMDLPAKPEVTETDRILETVWLDWAKYWQSNFPEELGSVAKN